MGNSYFTDSYETNGKGNARIVDIEGPFGGTRYFTIEVRYTSGGTAFVGDEGDIVSITFP
jgi:hypothetical protein